MRMTAFKACLAASLAIALAIGSTSAAQAESAGQSEAQFGPAAARKGFFVRLGLGGVKFNTDADISVGGAGLAGANADASSNGTILFDVGYRFNDRFSVTFTGGIPPKTTLSGTGVLAGQDLGKIRYAPAVLAAQYHFLRSDVTSYYVGAGVNHTFFFHPTDLAISDLKVKNAWAPVLQVGFETQIRDRWSIYGDVKQIFLDTDATGTVGGAPAAAKITADPTVISFGLQYAF